MSSNNNETGYRLSFEPEPVDAEFMGDDAFMNDASDNDISINNSNKKPNQPNKPNDTKNTLDDTDLMLAKAIAESQDSHAKELIKQQQKHIEYYDKKDLQKTFGVAVDGTSDKNKPVEDNKSKDEHKDNTPKTSQTKPSTQNSMRVPTLEDKLKALIVEIHLNKKPYTSFNNISIYPNFLTLLECRMLMKIFDPDSYIKTDVQHVQIMHFEHQVLADVLWQRLKSQYKHEEVVDKYGELWRAYAIHPKFRLCFYDINGHFNNHIDNPIVERVNSRSFASIKIYLNTLNHNNMEGGATYFCEQSLRIQPKSRLAVAYLNDKLKNSEEPVIDGVKYVLQADVMYVLHHSKAWEERIMLHELEQNKTYSYTPDQLQQHYAHVAILSEQIQKKCSVKDHWEEHLDKS